MDEAQERKLLARALAAHPNLAWEILEQPPRLNGAHGDALLRLRYGDREWLYMAEVKPGLRPATVGPALAQLAHLGPRALLVTDYVTPQLADKLRAEGAAFLAPMRDGSSTCETASSASRRGRAMPLGARHEIMPDVRETALEAYAGRRGVAGRGALERRATSLA